MNPRAITYRQHHSLPDDVGTAVNVQAMVFGNMGEDSAAGVCFTRNPSTGENQFCGENLLNAQGEAVRCIDPARLDQLLHPSLDPDAERHILGRGLPASPGAASGKVVFTAAAETWAGKGEKVILVRQETSPEEFGGMHVAEGIHTLRGGMTIHAAVVARGMGTPCVAGAGDLRVDAEAKELWANDEVIKEGDVITIDGARGEVMKGRVPTIKPEMSGNFATLMEWVDGFRTMEVRANAQTPLGVESEINA